MIKIIKPGYLKEIQCSKCGAVLSYDENEDVETRYEKGIASITETYRKPVKYLTCPQCKNEIVLKAALAQIYSNLGLSVCTVNIGFRPQAILRVTLSVDIVDRDIVRKRVEEAKEDETNSNSH